MSTHRAPRIQNRIDYRPDDSAGVAARHDRIVQQVIGNHQLEGIEVDTDTVNDIYAVLEGRRSPDDVIRDMIARYTEAGV